VAAVYGHRQYKIELREQSRALLSAVLTLATYARCKCQFHGELGKIVCRVDSTFCRRLPDRGPQSEYSLVFRRAHKVASGKRISWELIRNIIEPSTPPETAFTNVRASRSNVSNPHPTQTAILSAINLPRKEATASSNPRSVRKASARLSF
jgi:hypothetical protein